MTEAQKKAYFHKKAHALDYLNVIKRKAVTSHGHQKEKVLTSA
jgi:hypothetical protein